jgi:putative FmdB family regulatory protein
MPIYEYRCANCGHEVEALQKLSDPVLTDCPACHAAALSKLVSAAGFQLKGSGWYATDFKGGSKPAAAKTSGDAPAAEAKSDSKGEAKGESKGEGKGDTKTGSKSEAGATASTGGSGTSCACH